MFACTSSVIKRHRKWKPRLRQSNAFLTLSVGLIVTADSNLAHTDLANGFDTFFTLSMGKYFRICLWAESSSYHWFHACQMRSCQYMFVELNRFE